MIDRRKLLVGGVATAALTPISPASAQNDGATSACVWPPPAWKNVGFPSHRWVNILFVHTSERFKDRYFWDGTYSMDAVKRFSWTVRDFRQNEFHWIDPRLMDLLFILHWRYCKDEIRIFSGYRTPQTNANLEGAAKNSQHMEGRALDIHLPNMDNDEVARSFEGILKGGVGMYPGKEFTHLDLGNMRRWVG
jgi:uncharacterized protein YcbK (DUF882 family)